MTFVSVSVRRHVVAALLAFGLFGGLACGDDDATSTSTPAATAIPTSAVTGQVGTAEPPAETATPAPASEFPLTLEQSDGQPLTLQRTPQRIVSLSPHATDIFCAIGASDQLVAVEMFANCPYGSDEKPAVDAFQPNLEAIAGFQPDLVYVFSDTEGIVDALRRIGIPVLYLELPTSIAGTLEQVVIFGRVTGHADTAVALVKAVQEQIDAVELKLAGVEQGPRVFHELDPALFTAAPESFAGDFYSILKAQNIAADSPDAYPQLTAEVVISRDPEVIVLADESGDVTAESVAARPGWDTMTAVKSGQICRVDPNLVNQPGPRLAEGLAALAKCLYPEIFG